MATGRNSALGGTHASVAALFEYARPWDATRARAEMTRDLQGVRAYAAAAIGNGRSRGVLLREAHARNHACGAARAARIVRRLAKKQMRSPPPARKRTSTRPKSC